MERRRTQDVAVLEDSVMDDVASLGVRSSSITGTLPLTGGRGGRTWRIDTTDGRLVLHRRRIRYPTSIAGEVMATAIASRFGVGPSIIAWNESTGLVLTRWIPGRAATSTGLRAEHLEAALLTLHRLHTVTDESDSSMHDLASLDPLTTRREYLALARNSDSLPTWARGAVRDAAELDAMAAALAASPSSAAASPRVLLHGDPVPGNLILTGDGVRLVDFEYAGIGDPWYEVGALCASLHLDAAAVDAAVRLYGRFGGAEPVQESTFVAAEAWSYVAAQSWVMWVAAGADLGARSPRWHRWSIRAIQRLHQASKSGRVDRLTAQLRS